MIARGLPARIFTVVHKRYLTCIFNYFPEEQDAGRLYQDDEYGLTCGDVFEDTIEDENNTEAPSTSSTKEPPQKEGPLNETEKRDIQSSKFFSSQFFFFCYDFSILV